MNPYELLRRIEALRSRLAALRGRPLIENDAAPPAELPGELLTGRLVRELRLAVANIFQALGMYGMDAEGHRRSALSEASDDDAAEHLYRLLGAAQSMAEVVERQERDTSK
jgi:hypothetical protein